MNEHTSPEPEKTASSHYLKYMLLYALTFAATLAAGYILAFGVNSFAKYVIGIDVFSPAIFGLVYLALFIALLLKALQKLTRRI